jgi:hypothetical protein
MESRNSGKSFAWYLTCEVNNRLKQILQVAVIAVYKGLTNLNIIIFKKTATADVIILICILVPYK